MSGGAFGQREGIRGNSKPSCDDLSINSVPVGHSLNTPPLTAGRSASVPSGLSASLSTASLTSAPLTQAAPTPTHNSLKAPLLGDHTHPHTHTHTHAHAHSRGADQEQQARSSRGSNEAGGPRGTRPSFLSSWEFPGWGLSTTKCPTREELETAYRHQHGHKHGHPKLGQCVATAICGNDITSSCLYTGGLVILAAGKLAPVCLLLVSALLYFFRNIYGEVVTALPLNGGCYNVLMNTTTKRFASAVACLSILSYVATAVVSGTDAILYLQAFLKLEPMNTPLSEVGVLGLTILLLFIFASLCFMGISESGTVALVMFVMHLCTLVTLCIAGTVYAVREDFSVLKSNLALPLTAGMSDPERTGNVAAAIFFGFSSSLLGISGFESSAQYVEEQAEGVFVKTLRNMWVCVAFFNPCIAFLALCIIPLDTFDAEGARTLLATMGRLAAGSWLEMMVSADAFIVLSGAVLTSYVGVTGLIRSMASDRCLPEFLLKTNEWRETNHTIIFGFFFLTSALLLITQRGVLFGDDDAIVNVEDLAGVYTFSFLGLLIAFTVGCMLLKYKRPLLPRDVTTSWASLLIAIVGTTVGLVGNLIASGSAIKFFVMYFVLVGGLVMIMFQRTFMMKVALKAMKHIAPVHWSASLQQTIQKVNESSCVFFLKHDNVVVLNKAILYVRENEQTNHLTICHIYDTHIPTQLEAHVQFMDSIYPKLQINLLCIKGTFSPEMCAWVASYLDVPLNMMMITCPDETLKGTIADYGMRVITTVPVKVPPSEASINQNEDTFFTEL